jgi:hypothetical protein
LTSISFDAIISDSAKSENHLKSGGSMDSTLKKVIEKAQDPENMRYPLFLILDDAVKSGLGNPYTPAEVISMSRLLTEAFRAIGISYIPPELLLELGKRLRQIAARIHGKNDFVSRFKEEVGILIDEIADMETWK